MAQPNFGHVFLYVAKEKGYFSEQAIDATITPIEGGDAILLKALIAGQVDTIIGNPSGALSAIEQGG